MTVHRLHDLLNDARDDHEVVVCLPGGGAGRIVAVNQRNYCVTLVVERVSEPTTAKVRP